MIHLMQRQVHDHNVVDQDMPLVDGLLRITPSTQSKGIGMVLITEQIQNILNLWMSDMKKQSSQRNKKLKKMQKIFYQEVVLILMKEQNRRILHLSHQEGQSLQVFLQIQFQINKR